MGVHATHFFDPAHSVAAEIAEALDPTQISGPVIHVAPPSGAIDWIGLRWKGAFPANYRFLGDDWERFWFLDQPSHLTPIRTHGGLGP